MASRKGGRHPAATLVSLGLVGALVAAACQPSPTSAPSASAVAAASPQSTPAASGSQTPGPTDDRPAPSDGPRDPGPATAADLILAARDAGEIDGPTALLYRVYAVFGDQRLPERYALGTWSDDEAGLGAALDQLDSLPDAIAADLRPYLVRPTDPTSAFFGPPESAASGPRLGPEMAMAAPLVLVGLPTVVCPGTWGYADGGGAFRVWGRCDGSPTERQARESQIEKVAIWMEQIWADEVKYLGRDPVPDEGTIDQGADPTLDTRDPGRKRIDVYITTGGVHRGNESRSPGLYAVAFPSAPFGGTGRAQTSSGYIVLNTNLLANPAFAKATLAHELFHVMENAFNRTGVRDGDHSYWFVESSAVWAQWAFAKEGSAVDHETMTPGRFEGFQDSSRPLTDAYQTSNRYWSWAWPLFMSQESAGAVAAAWQALVGKSGNEETTRAVDSVLPFATRFRDFAVRAHNQALTPTQDPDLQKLFPEPAVGAPRLPPGSARMDDQVTLHAELPGVNGYSRSEFLLSLYAVYRPFEVDDDVGKVVFDFSGLAPQATFDVDAIVKIKDKGWERRKLTNGETTFCRDKAKDRVEEIVIVISNHDLDRNARVVGTWTAESLQVGCAALTGVLTVQRDSLWFELDPRLPAARADEHLTATIVVNMRPDPWSGGYTDAWDPSDPAGGGSSTYTISRTAGSSKQMGDCTASYSTKSFGTWAFKDHPTDPLDENSITAFVDRPTGLAGISIVVHYPYEIIENICNYDAMPNIGVHDAFICLEARLVEVDDGPDQVNVHCESDVPQMGFSETHLVMDGTLTLLDE